MSAPSKILYIRDNIRVKIDLRPYDERSKKAQWLLGNNVLHSCKACMPQRDGILKDNSRVEDGGRKVVFETPYARFQYGGKVMVDPDTGSAWAREGVEKVLTNKLLKYSDPNARPKWFEHAKERDLQSWIKSVKDMVGGK